MTPSVLVTAGPTRERLDPVRYLSNYSTGLFGYEIAAAARARGFRATLISGPVALQAPAGVRIVRVETAGQMRRAVLRELGRHTHLIMAAAVADWRPVRCARVKLKRGKRAVTLRLVPNPDILKEAATAKGRRVVAGFALESRDLAKRAAHKLKEKNIDLIIANRANTSADPFGGGSKDILIIDRKGNRARYRNRSKRALAKIILDKVLNFTI